MADIDPAKLEKTITKFLNDQVTPIEKAIDALIDDQTKIQDQADLDIAAKETQIQTLNDLYKRATGTDYVKPKTANKKSKGAATKAGVLTGAALEAKGTAALAYLKKKAGEWVDGKDLAEHIDYHSPAAAIEAIGMDGMDVEKQGPGRARQYRIKK